MIRTAAFLVTVLWMSLVVHCDVGWIDPFNMNVGSSHKEEKCLCDVLEPVNTDLSHYRRSINLLLTSVAVDRTDSLYYKGQLSIKIPIESYDYLRQFTKDSREDPVALKKVDRILTSIFSKPTIEQFSEVVLSWSDHLYFTFFNRTTGILLSVLFVTFISYKLLRANWTLSLVIKYLVFLAWTIDFAFTWIHLLQEGEINKIADSIRFSAVPPHCDPKKMSFFQYFLSAFSTEDECRKYHKVMLKDIFWSIGPFTVFSHQFGQVVLTPASYIGSAISDLTRGLLNGLTWPINILMLPVLLLFTLILLCIVLSFVTQTTFNVNIFHLLQFSFGNDTRKSVGDVVSGENLMKLLDGAIHRPMIEDVKDVRSSKNSPNSKKPDKQSSKHKKNKDAEIEGTKLERNNEKKLPSVERVIEKHKDETKINTSDSEAMEIFCEGLSNESFTTSTSSTDDSLNFSIGSVNSSDLDLNKHQC